MNEEQVNEAFKQNVITFPRVEKLPVDPPIAGQNYGLFSFKLLPKPIDGVYGFLKFRGAFNTVNDFETHAKNIIRSIDSKHKLFPYPQGHWFPLTDNPKYAQEDMEVSDKDTLTDIYMEKNKNEMDKEKQRMKTIQERQKALIEESKRETPDTDSLKYYAEKTMQLDQINEWLTNLRKRKRDLTNALEKTRREIERLNQEHPDYRDQVNEEIQNIRADVGLN